MLQLDIVTPHRKLLSTSCDSVILPGVNGEFEVLEGHTPVLTTLKPGVLSFRHANSTVKLMVAEGFAEADNTHVSVLVESAALPEEIDIKAEQELIDKLQKELANIKSGEDVELKHMHVQIERATAKLQIF